ncbi:MAG: hypothetical protein QOE90_271 [Thermoplasmata archaeon]|jgi:hypothetical protein|nr:hypothetical protein [Thermoplasmata archaeon]
MSEEPPVRRDEFEALRARVRELEARLAPARGPAVACMSCGMRMAPADRFCGACGAPRPGVRPPAPAPAPPPMSRPLPAQEPVAFEAVEDEPASWDPKPRPSLETALGQRLAPRVGAVLVFLAALFFLGLGVERGWIGPPAQLALAALVALALIGLAAWLARAGRYGAYPQILAATGACILYVEAFVAHALPYYADVTGLSDLGSGALMALVALGTVGVALWRDARVLVGLGYVLAFTTAGLGWGVLPAVTLAYVALLGASLALVVAWKRWTPEAGLGTLVTGGFLVGLAWFPPPDGAPALAVAVASIVPAAAFLLVALRPAPGDDPILPPLVGAVSLAWALAVSLAPLPREQAPVGLALLAWCAVSLGLVFAARRFAPGPGATVFATCAMALFVVGVPLAWSGAPEPDLLTTCTYALAALAIALASRSRGAWVASAALAVAALLHAVFLDDRLRPAALLGGDDALLGGWQAWVTLALLAPVLVFLMARAPGTSQRVVAFTVTALFALVWAFALFASPFLATLFLLALAGVFAGIAAARSLDVSVEASGAAMLVAILAAAKAATFDAHVVSPAMPPWAAAIESALAVAALLAVHHGGSRGLSRDTARLSAIALVGGSAAVLASFAFAYLQGAWISVALGALGVAYLAAGFAMRAQATYRYTGFGVLGFVILRVFAVDLSETDLAVRAGIFALLGAILLGVGYVYARMARNVEPPS